MTNGNNNLIKRSGQVFTPYFLVNTILDYAGYTAGNILDKHIIDNSCGDGAFLCAIAERYAAEYKKVRHTTIGLSESLAKYVHGIEKDKTAYENCHYNLNATAHLLGIDGAEWDILCDDALNVKHFDGKMDFVVGNPPYVRVHNLGENYDNVKSFDFAQNGMTDLYLVFYELGLRMLNTTGKLCYITPSSWLSSLAATNMRKYIVRAGTLAGLIDLCHFQAFDKATTYTMIALFDMQNKHRTTDYYTYSPQTHEKIYVDTLAYDDIFVDNKFYVGRKSDLALLRSIKISTNKGYAQVKNGFATLADKVFIVDVAFDTFTIPILKASTGKWYRGFYPYDAKGKPLAHEVIFSHPEVAAYLNGHKTNLLKGCTEQQNPAWYLYGRTQALKDVGAEKYAINTMIKDKASIKLTEVHAGAGLYSGLYIMTDMPYALIEKAVKNDDFISYLAMLKNYKSGGYYTFGSKDLEQYLNYKLSHYERAKHHISAYE